MRVMDDANSTPTPVIRSFYPAQSSKQNKDPTRCRTKAMAKSPTSLTESDLVTFDHVAAGHDGITSNIDGSLIIKPCTQAEIDFYEAAQTGHDDLQAHLPTFIGVLALSPNQNAPTAGGVGPLLQAHQAVPSTLASHIPGGWLPSKLTTNSHPLPPPTASEVSKRVSWKPSGGKKLNTPTAIVLENISAGFQHPNILDVKLGSRLWADDAPDSKRRKLDEVAKETTSGSLGFRIAGMKRWVGDAQPNSVTSSSSSSKEQGMEFKSGYLTYNKTYGRNFTAKNVKDGFAEFFFGGANNPKTNNKVIARDVIPALLAELEHIHAALQSEESRMYSASVLIVYEGGDERDVDAAVKGDQERTRRVAVEEEAAEDGDGDGDEEDGGDDNEEEEEELPKLYDIRLIDFAHATFVPGQGPDTNVLGGVESLIRILGEMLRE